VKINMIEMHEGKFSSEEMKEVFDKVKSEEHWKLPIDVLVAEEWVQITEASICHFQGCVPDVSFEREEFGVKWFRVESPGYVCD